eukprot:sb/3463333/
MANLTTAILPLVVVSHHEIMKSTRKRSRHAHSSPEPLTPETPKRKSKVADALDKISCTRDSIMIGKRKRSSSTTENDIQKWVEEFRLFSSADKLRAIDMMSDCCDTNQARHIIKRIEPRFQCDFITRLPKELAITILQFLEPRDLINAMSTCKTWKVLCDDPLLWRDKCRALPEIPSHLYESKQLDWKRLFLLGQELDENWRTGKNFVRKELKGHDDHVITCLQFHGDRIVSGSDDSTLKVWSVEQGECLLTLTGHTGGVWCSQLVGDIVCSGSTDRTIKVWNIESGECLHTLYGHSSTVRCLAMHETTVVSGSRDATLRVWNVLTGECKHLLIGHMAAVRCVQFDGKRVVSGAYDCQVKVWDPTTETCLYSLTGHTNRVYSLQFDGRYVVSGSLDTTIRVWDTQDGSCVHVLSGHRSLTSGMELCENILVSGNADSYVKIWDIRTGTCLQTLDGPSKHLSAVTCLLFNKKYVMTSSDDGTVKLWDIKTGEFIRNLVGLESSGRGGVVWRIQLDKKRLVCAVGSRNGTEETKLIVFDFSVGAGKEEDSVTKELTYCDEEHYLKCFLNPYTSVYLVTYNKREL